MNCFDEKYTIQPAFIHNQSCQAVGEHDGDVSSGTWTCCGEEDHD